jgi:hypothetical protein
MSEQHPGAWIWGLPGLIGAALILVSVIAFAIGYWDARPQDIEIHILGPSK